MKSDYTVSTWVSSCSGVQHDQSLVMYTGPMESMWKVDLMIQCFKNWIMYAGEEMHR